MSLETVGIHNKFDIFDISFTQMCRFTKSNW